MMTRTALRGLLLTTCSLSLTVFYLLPVYWMLNTSLKPANQIFLNPPGFVPDPPTLNSYQDAVFSNPDIVQGLINSGIIAVGTTILTVAIAVPAAYGLARFKVRFASAILLLFLVVQMVPSVNLALPMYALFTKFGLVDTYPGLIVANAALTVPMCIVIMRPYFLSVPDDIIDAAKSDGCNAFTAFLRIAVPVSVPGITTIAALSFIGGWGEYVLGLSLTSNETKQPVSVLLAGLSSHLGTEWNNVMALSVVMALPMIALFVFLQRYIVGGLTEGSTKS